MTALAQSIGRRATARSAVTTDVILVVLGSLFVAGMAQLEIKLPFTPVPISGQTLAVLLVGGALGALRGGASLLLYLAEGAVGLPFFSGGDSGLSFLKASSATGGYLWGFVIAAVVVGWLSEKLNWDREFGSAIGAMFVGEVIIFAFGVPWLAAAIDVPILKAMEFGLYPFIVGDAIKLLIAAGLLPGTWKLIKDKT